MSERTTASLMTFRHPFELRDVVGVQPPGTYQIETVELTIDGLSFVAFRRVSTTITLPAIGAEASRRQFVEIDPTDLVTAQEQDLLRSETGYVAPAAIALR